MQGRTQGTGESRENLPINVKNIPIAKIWMGVRAREDLGDIDRLAEDIAEVGLLHPIVVQERKDKEKGIECDLIAGGRRLAACEKLGWENIPANVVNIESIARGEFSENAFSKPLTPSEAMAVLKKVEESRIGHRPSKKDMEKGATGTPFPSGKTRDIVAILSDLSPATVGKLKAIDVAAKKDPVTFGHLSMDINTAEKIGERYEELGRLKLLKQLGKPPEGEYNTIFLNPDWELLASRTRKRMNPSETFFESTIQVIHSCSKGRRDVFAETTDEYLEISLKLLRTYDFQFYGELILIKTYDEDGCFTSKEHEHLLVGRRSNRIPTA